MADLTSRKARIEEEQLPRLERIVEQAEAALAFLLSQHNTLHGAFLAAAASTPSPSASTHPVQTDPPTTNVSPQVAHLQHSLPSWPVHPPPFPVARPPPLGLAAKDLLTDIESGWAQMLQAALADAKVACSCACAASHHAAQHRITPHHTASHCTSLRPPCRAISAHCATPHNTTSHRTAPYRRTAPHRTAPRVAWASPSCCLHGLTWGTGARPPRDSDPLVQIGRLNARTAEESPQTARSGAAGRVAPLRPAGPAHRLPLPSLAPSWPLSVAGAIPLTECRLCLSC